MAGVLSLAGCALSGCGQSRVGSPIDGVRTDPDQRGLMVSYTGGACDGAAHLKVTETATRIDADVVVRGGRGSCTAVGIPRTLAARLEQPVGARTLWSGGYQQVPFDGARLLTPTSLPTGFAGTTETGFADLPTDDVGAASVTSTWVVARFDPSRTSADGGCQPTRGSLEVRVGPASAPLARGLSRAGSVEVRHTTAQVFRGGTSRKPDFWAYGWTTGTSSVVVSSGPRCSGDRILTQTELLAVAESLRPA